MFYAIKIGNSVPEYVLIYLSGSNIRELLVDADNFDFRPQLNNALTNTDNTFTGPYSPYIGSSNTNTYLGHYWIPGRKLQKVSFPIPTNGAIVNKMRDVVMCQTGYRLEFL